MNMESGRQRIVMARYVILALITSMIAFSISSIPQQLALGAAAAQPTLQINAPAQVELGQPITLTFVVKNAVDVAGYEAHVRFDTNAAHFTGLRQRQNDLKRQGRDLIPLTAIDLTDGVAIGAASCSVADCVAGQGPKQNTGGQGTLTLGTLLLGTDQPGTLDIAVDGLRFVNGAGQPVAVALPPSTLTVRVGGTEQPMRYAASHSTWSRPSRADGVAAPTVFDLTGDGVVSYGDVAEQALAWTHAREQGNPCGRGIDATRDVNRDGCLDIVDVQRVVAQVGARNVTSSAGTGDTASANPSLSPAAVATFVVRSPADTSDAKVGDGMCASRSGCTLRAAIQEANAHSGPDRIEFSLPDTGPQTIQLNSTLPALSDQSGGTTIDGYTQPGAIPNTDPTISNAQIMVQIAGQGQDRFDAFWISSASNRIQGLAIYNVKVSFYLFGSGAYANAIAGNFVGTNATGTFQSSVTGVRNGAHGISLYQGTNHNRIGGVTPADRNVISGNSATGVATFFEGTDFNIIQGNIIGLSPKGDARLTNGNHGIDINSQSSYNIIGGPGSRERNILSGNRWSGIEISHSTLTVGNKVLANYIGTNVNGTGGGENYTYNGQWGIHFEDGPNNNLIAYNVIGNNRPGGIQFQSYNTSANQVANNRIGIGTDGSAVPNNNFGVQVAYHAGRMLIGPGNIIANNGVGVSVEYYDNNYNTITQNSIYNNSVLGIDLGAETGVSYNDPGDSDDGGNHGLNYPVLSSATQYQVKGMACATPLASTPGPCTIEVFIAQRVTGDAGGGNYGQGKTFVGSATANTDGTFVVAVNGVHVGDVVTATATNAVGDTSEFSQNIVVTNGVPPSPTATPTSTPQGTVPYARDTFSRTVENGWGNAEIGGGYAVEAPNRPTVDYDVDGDEGTINMTTAGQWRSAFLPAVSIQDVDERVRVKIDELPTGGYAFAYLVARRVGAGTQYMGRMGIAGAGNLFVQAVASTQVSGQPSLTLLGAQTAIPNVRTTSDTYVWLRMEVAGTDPTTIRMKVWADDQSEPTTWAYTVTDSTPSLQTAGAVGLRAYVSSGVSRLPLRFTFDNFQAVSPGSTPVTPTPTATTPTPTPTDTSTAAPSPTATATHPPLLRRMYIPIAER